MIVGIGVDLIELNRIRAVIEQGERLAERILTNKELAVYQSLALHKKVEFLGGRFAAKEAVSKAFGTGIGTKLSLEQIEVLADERGVPTMQVSSPFLDTENLNIHLSISHSRENAVALVILERPVSGR